MKSEPEVFSIEHLKKKKTSLWDGVRNYQARNFMTQQMEVGDAVLFYHSSTDPAGVAGLARVSKAATPDPSQFDKKSEYYDAKATVEKPIWFCVTVEYVSTFPKIVELSEIRKEKALKDMALLKRGQRLSIQPTTAAEYAFIVKMSKT